MLLCIRINGCMTINSVVIIMIITVMDYYYLLSYSKSHAAINWPKEHWNINWNYFLIALDRLAIVLI